MANSIEKDKQELDFESDLNRLDEISDLLTSPSTNIDEAMDLYAEGQKIIKRLERSITRAKAKIEKLVKEENDLTIKVDEEEKTLENMTKSN